MQPTQELVDQLYREKIERARRMTPEQRFRAGAELFELGCRVMADGIRHQFPDADETRVQEILRYRLAVNAKLEGGR